MKEERTYFRIYEQIYCEFADFEQTIMQELEELKKASEQCDSFASGENHQKFLTILDKIKTKLLANHSQNKEQIEKSFKELVKIEVKAKASTQRIVANIVQVKMDFYLKTN